MEYRVAALRRN